MTVKGAPAETQRLIWARAGVAALFFASGTTVGAWVPHIPDRAHTLGLNSAQLGATLLAGGVGCLMAMPLSGWLIKRFGSRQVASVAGTLFPVGLAAAVLVPTAALMAEALALTGMAGASMDVAMNAHGVLVEKRLGRRTISLFHGLFSVGCVAGSAGTSIALAHHVSARTIVCLIAGMLGLLVLAARRALFDDDPRAMRATLLSQTPVHSAPQPTALPLPLGVNRLAAHLPNGRLLLLGVLTFSTMVSEGAVGDWSALLLRVTRGLGDGVVGYGFTSFSATMVLGRLTGDRVVTRLGETGTLRFGGLLGVLGLGLMLATPLLPLMLTGFAVAGLGLSNVSPILYRAAGRLPGVDPGAAIATAVGVGYAGLLAGPPALGFLADVAGLRSIFYVLIALCALVGLAASLVEGASKAAATFEPGESAAAETVL